MTGGVDGDTFVVTTLPTEGTLWYNNAPVAVDDAFTPAEMVLNKLEYRHNGLATDADTFGVVARNVDTGDSDEATFNVTISADNAGWLLYVQPADFPPELVCWSSTKWKVEDVAAQWGTLHWGDATVLEMDAGLTDQTAFVSGLLTQDSYKFLEGLVSSPIGMINGSTAQAMASKLLTELNEAANSDLKALVGTHGADLEMDPTVWASLTADQQTRWQKLKDSLDISPTRRVVITNSDWHGAIHLG